MNTHHENFKAWYADILTSLYPRREAGFAILMIAFPLLERYLRQKLQLPAQATLNNSFYDELIQLFPQLQDRTTAKKFWHVYRNGILHEVTLSKINRRGNLMPVGSLSHNNAIVSIESDGRFFIHPVLFSQHVVQTIENDFTVFERTDTSPLPKAKEIVIRVIYFMIELVDVSIVLGWVLISIFSLSYFLLCLDVKIK